MILPVFLDMSPCEPLKYLWHFYGAVNLQKQTGGPVAAPEDYFAKPSELVQGKDSRALWGNVVFENQAVPSDADMEKIRACPIPNALLEQLAREKGARSEASIALFAAPQPALCDWLRATLAQLERDTGEKPEAVLAMTNLPSVELVCREKGIPLLYYEFCAFRTPNYYNAAYYAWSGTHVGLRVEEQYREFCAQAAALEDWEWFTPQEILALWLMPQKLRLLSLWGGEPEYEVGVLAETIFHGPTQADSRKNTLDLLDAAFRRYPKEQVLVRSHPSDLIGPHFERTGAQRDTSASPIEFIAKCRRIFSRTSNSVVEALLWGRSVYCLDKEPYGFACLPSPDIQTAQDIDVRFLNFMAFGFYFPRALVYDGEYLHWRLGKPSWMEIYRKNITYCREMLAIPEEVLRRPGQERLGRILAARGADSAGRLLADPVQWEALPQIRSRMDALYAQAQNGLNAAGAQELLRLYSRCETLEGAQKAQGKAELPLEQAARLGEGRYVCPGAVYLDLGRGYCEENKCAAQMHIVNGAFRVEFDLGAVCGQMRALRWDPIEGRTVKLRPNDPPAGVSLSPENAALRRGGWDFFLTGDPMYRVTGSAVPAVLVFTGQIEFTDGCETTNALLEELSAARRQETELRQVCAARAERMEQLGRRCAELDGNLRAAQTAAARAESRAAEMRNENTRLHEEYEQQGAHNRALKAELWEQRTALAAMQASKSWRLTAPLRALIRRLRRAFRR